MPTPPTPTDEGRPRTAAVLREAVVSAWNAPVAGLLTLTMVAGMCVAVLLTTGRTQAAEDAALAQIDAAGTRSIVVRGEDGAGLTSALVDRLRTVEAVEQVTAYGPVTDVRNALVPGARPLGLRPVYGDVPGNATPGTVVVSSRAAESLGLVDATGDLVTDDGVHVTAAARMEVPEHLTFLEPLAVLVPASSREEDEAAGDPVSLVVVLARSPDDVGVLARTVTSLAAAEDPTAVSVQTSEQLAQVRAAVSGQLGAHGRETVLGILLVAGALVAVNLFALVTMRRRDFGRRRALGASQALIVCLLLTQTGVLAAVGAIVGTSSTVVVLTVTGAPVPGAAYIGAVAVASLLVAVVAAVLPAVAAARREPLHELRVP